MRGFLLDTNVVSEGMRQRPDTQVLETWRQHQRITFLCAPVVHELVYGVARLPPGRRRERLETYVEAQLNARNPVLPFGLPAALWMGRQRARLSALGRTPSAMDAQIAAIASVNGLTLVTRNTSDFQDFEGLSLQNWFS